MYKWSCGSSALQEKALIFLWSNVQTFLVMPWNYGRAHLGAKHNKGKFPFSFIPFSANPIKQVTSRFSETGSADAMEAATGPPHRSVCCRFARTLLGLERHSMARHRGCTQLTWGLVPYWIRPERLQVIIQAISLRTESCSQLRSKGASVTVLS